VLIGRLAILLPVSLFFTLLGVCLAEYMDGRGIGGYLVPAAAVFSALIAATTAYQARLQSEHHLKIGNTFEILKERRTAAFEQSLKSVIDLHLAVTDNPSLEPEFGEAWAVANLEVNTRKNLVYLINYFQEIAIGLENGLYDRIIVRKALGRIIKDFWPMVLPLINEARANAVNKIRDLEGNERAPYIELENLVESL
jgi:hypothetical protein